MLLSPGTLVDGAYRVEALLGEGGMGAVYRARDLGRNVDVALKLLSRELSSDAELLQRFEREAQLAARLGPEGGVVGIHRIGTHAGLAYCAMELIEGGDLERLLQEGLERSRGLELLEDVARTLARCHAAGVVHRDVKPGNVLIDERGRVRLCDFGIAVDVSTQQRLTQSTDLLGTPSYMAPEQALSALEVGPPADVYSLGVLLYELLTGRVPFEGGALQVLSQLVEDAPPPPSQIGDVTRDEEALCLRLLRKDPATRPTAGEVAEFFKRLRAGEPLGLSRRGMHPRTVIALSVVAGVALILSAVFLKSLRVERQRRAALDAVASLESEVVIGLRPAASSYVEEIARAAKTLRGGRSPNEEAVDALDRADALALWSAAPDPLPERTGAGIFVRLVHARLLIARERPAEALPLLEAIPAKNAAAPLVRRVRLEALRARHALALDALARCEPQEAAARLRDLRGSRSRIPTLTTKERAGWIAAQEADLRRFGVRWSERLERTGFAPDDRSAVLLELREICQRPFPCAWQPELERALQGWCRRHVLALPEGKPRQALVKPICHLLDELSAFAPTWRWGQPWIVSPLRGYVRDHFDHVRRDRQLPETIVFGILALGIQAPRGLTLRQILDLQGATQASLERLAGRRAGSRALTYWRACERANASDEAKRAGRNDEQAEAVALSQALMAQATSPSTFLREDLSPDWQSRGLRSLAKTLREQQQDAKPNAKLLSMAQRSVALARHHKEALVEAYIALARETAFRDGYVWEAQQALSRECEGRLGELAKTPDAFRRGELERRRRQLFLGLARVALKHSNHAEALSLARTGISRVDMDHATRGYWELRALELRCLRDLDRRTELLARLEDAAVGVTKVDVFAVEAARSLVILGDLERLKALSKHAFEARRGTTTLAQILRENGIEVPR